MFCSKCGNELKEDMKFCNKCGNKVVEIKENICEKQSKEGPKEKEIWKKIIIISICMFIITLILKMLINNNIVFYILNIPLCLSMIGFVGAFIWGGIKMKMNKNKWPMWYILIFILVLSVIICCIIGNYYSKKNAQEMNQMYYNTIYNVNNNKKTNTNIDNILKSIK